MLATLNRQPHGWKPSYYTYEWGWMFPKWTYWSRAQPNTIWVVAVSQKQSSLEKDFCSLFHIAILNVIFLYKRRIFDKREKNNPFLLILSLWRSVGGNVAWSTNIIFTLECILILIHKYTLVVVALARYRYQDIMRGFSIQNNNNNIYDLSLMF